MKTLKQFTAGLALCAVTAMTAFGNIVYYSDNLLNTNFIINASGGTGGTTTNPASANYSTELPNGWVSTKGLTLLSQNPATVTFQIATMQLPSGFTGTTYTNAGYVYSNGVYIAGTVIPQYATNLTLNLGLALDDATLVSHLPPSTNNVIAVTATASASTNTVQNWIVQVPATNFLSAKYFKTLSVQYGGSNALQVVSTRVGFWTETW